MKFSRPYFWGVATLGFLVVAAVGQAVEFQSPRLEIRQTEAARFPATLIAQGITRGEAWVVISIDPEGRLSDALASRYTDRAFANEAIRVLRKWRYTPVRVQGQAISICTEVHFLFEATGCIISLDPMRTIENFTAIANRPDYQTRLCTAAELDRLPSVTHQVSPAHPGQTPEARRKGGRALIEFIVDETGRARMPILISALDPEFGKYAADALTQWKFTPPTRRGQPVAVWVRQEFVFPGES